MSRICHINYADALAGRIHNRRSPMHPIGAWLAALGATYVSSEFVDAELSLGEDHFENIRMIVRSSRKQGHDGVEIRLTPDSLSAIESRITEISVLEDAEVTANIYSEHRGRENVIVTFPKRKHDWLFELAKRKLSENEYTELRQLIAARIKRSEREILLTEKAIASQNEGSESYDQSIKLVSPEYSFEEFCRLMFGKNPVEVTGAASAEIAYAQRIQRQRTGGRGFRKGSRGRTYCDNLQNLVRLFMGSVPIDTSRDFLSAVRPLALDLLQRWTILGLREFLDKASADPAS